MVAHLLAQLGLDSFEQVSIHNGWLLAGQGLALEGHLSDIKSVAKQVVERTTCERDTADGLACLQSPLSCRGSVGTRSRTSSESPKRHSTAPRDSIAVSEHFRGHNRPHFDATQP
jgi:hypothetical protein